MSADSEPTGRVSGDSQRALACGLCDRRVALDDLLGLQCYADADAPLPGVADSDGFLGACPDCASEVDELLAVWTAHDRPPVGPGRPVSAGYRAVAPACSFCDRDLDGSLLGVEYYRPGADAGDRSDDYRNFSLCGRCVDVFAEFLRGVREDATC